MAIAASKTGGKAAPKKAPKKQPALVTGLLLGQKVHVGAKADLKSIETRFNAEYFDVADGALGGMAALDALEDSLCKDAGVTGREQAADDLKKVFRMAYVLKRGFKGDAAKEKARSLGAGIRMARKRKADKAKGVKGKADSNPRTPVARSVTVTAKSFKSVLASLVTFVIQAESDEYYTEFVQAVSGLEDARAEAQAEKASVKDTINKAAKPKPKAKAAAK